MRHLFVLVLLLSLGCSSNYTYTAIRRAREHAVEHHPELSEKSIHQIKFTEPVLANDMIYSRGGTRSGSKHDTTQTVIYWKLPDEDGKTLMVVGFGRRDLFDWYPNRSIIRHFRRFEDEKAVPRPPATAPSRHSARQEGSE
ncbi:MAG: hypothetical protein JW808_06780 [Victivallales bacterium]|nr:hypothetical protein [Victivallales bacterium]